MGSKVLHFLAAKKKFERPRSSQISIIGKMSALMYPTVEFNFIVGNNSNKSNSRLNIKKRQNGNIQWKFEQGSCICETIEMKTEEEVRARVRMMFNMLEWDTDPFDNVLMNFPGFPAVRISMTNATKAFSDIMRMISLVFENWASTVDMEEENHICDSRICEDNGDEDEDEDANDYNDMPALIPINEYPSHILPQSPPCEVECECGLGQCDQMAYMSRTAPFRCPPALKRQRNFPDYYNSEQ